MGGLVFCLKTLSNMVMVADDFVSSSGGELGTSSLVDECVSTRLVVGLELTILWCPDM